MPNVEIIENVMEFPLHPGLKLVKVNGAVGYLRSDCAEHMFEVTFNSLVKYMYGQTVMSVSTEEDEEGEYSDSLFYADDVRRWRLGLPVID